MKPIFENFYQCMRLVMFKGFVYEKMAALYVTVISYLHDFGKQIVVFNCFLDFNYQYYNNILFMWVLLAEEKLLAWNKTCWSMVSCIQDFQIQLRMRNLGLPQLR